MNRYVVVLACAFLVIAGCGKDDGPGYFPAEGTVLLDGNPVEGAAVTFSPQSGPGNTGTVSMGLTDAEGKFVMRTGTGKVGAALGKHNVAIELIVMPEAPPEPEGDGLAPALPNEMATVDALQASAAAVPRPLYLVPRKYSDPKTSGLTAEIPSGGITDIKFELTAK